MTQDRTASGERVGINKNVRLPPCEIDEECSNKFHGILTGFYRKNMMFYGAFLAYMGAFAQVIGGRRRSIGKSFSIYMHSMSYS